MADTKYSHIPPYLYHVLLFYRTEPQFVYSSTENYDLMSKRKLNTSIKLKITDYNLLKWTWFWWVCGLSGSKLGWIEVWTLIWPLLWVLCLRFLCCWDLKVLPSLLRRPLKVTLWYFNAFCFLPPCFCLQQYASPCNNSIKPHLLNYPKIALWITIEKLAYPSGVLAEFMNL